jgi:hypothetical protein
MTLLRQPAWMTQPTLFTTEALLGTDFPMPLDRPFTASQALAAGVTRAVLRRLLRDHYIRRLVKGVFVAAQVPDSLMLRAQALHLVVPEDAVIVDWTAVWLYTGVLPPNQHLAVPPVSVFRPRGRGRLRNGLCSSGERSLTPDDVVTFEGLTVTTPIRTAWDIGRLAPRDMAIGALDALLRMGDFSHEQLLAGVERFRRQRGVVQLRALAPLADPRSQSTAESVLRLRWCDLPSLPRPEPQVPILDAHGREIYYLDLGVRELRFAVEYDGEEFHSSDEDLEHDRLRRRWIARNHGWVIEPVRKANVFGPTRDIEQILYRGVADARRRLGLPRS